MSEEKNEVGDFPLPGYCVYGRLFGWVSEKTWKMDDLSETSEKELKEVGIGDMKKSAILPSVDSFFVDRDKEYHVVLFARSYRAKSMDELVEIKKKLDAIRTADRSESCKYKDKPIEIVPGSGYSNF